MCPILTTLEVAELLQCSDETVEIAARDGKLPGVKFGRTWVFPLAALLDCVNAQGASEMTARRAADPAPAHVSIGVALNVGRKAANSSRIRPRPELPPMPEVAGVAGR